MGMTERKPQEDTLTTVQPLPEQTDAVLRDLMQILVDGERGFAKAADALADDGHTELASKMKDFAEQRQRLSMELQEAASDYATISDADGTTSGGLHRAWMGLTDALTGDDPHAVLAEAERGEDRAKATYEKVLKEDLPEDLKTIISRQAREVISAHDEVRDLRDQHAE